MVEVEVRVSSSLRPLANPSGIDFTVLKMLRKILILIKPRLGGRSDSRFLCSLFEFIEIEVRIRGIGGRNGDLREWSRVKK